MLSRRRRYKSSSSSDYRSFDNRRDIIVDNVEIWNNNDLSTSTKRPSTFNEKKMVHIDNRHVDIKNLWIYDEYIKTSANSRDLRSTDRIINMIKYNDNFRILSSRIIDSNKRRKRWRNNELILDNNDDNSISITNEPSSILTIVNKTAININDYPLIDETRTHNVNVDSSINDRTNDNYDNSTIKTFINDKIDDNEYETNDRKRFRNDNDKINKNHFLRDKKKYSKRQTNDNTITKNLWKTKKNRFIIVVGLLMWCTMITEIESRQNHHRTCPGCPHQHVHGINRKIGTENDGTEATVNDPAPTPDDLRLEAIKHQILTKLGLRTRPDVNRTLASVPRHLALETLYRAEAQPASNRDRDRDSSKRRNHNRNNNPTIDNDDRSTSSRSSDSYGQFYYAGDEYSYRNVDSDLIGNVEKSRNRENNENNRGSSYIENERHRAHGDFHDDTADNNDDERVSHDNEADQDNQVEMDDFYARTSEIITFAEPGRTLNGQPLLEFPRSSGDPALEPLKIKRATLWARVELRHAHHYQHHRRAQPNQRNITLWVFRVKCGNVTHLRGKELGEHLEMVTSLGVNVNQLGWQKFDVTRVVSNWYSGGDQSSMRHEKLTLLVDCTGCGSHVHVSTFGVQSPNVVESSLNSQGGEDPDRPFLVVRTDPAAVKRVRRRAIECSGAIKGQCCKQRFYVSFSQLGWDDWIIAPQGYYANYCRGDCAAGHRTPDTFLNYYTHVIEEYRKMDRLAGMQPCCAPLKFSPMSLIYYGPDSNIIKRDLPKMVVDECGCP